MVLILGDACMVCQDVPSSQSPNSPEKISSARRKPALNGVYANGNRVEHPELAISMDASVPRDPKRRIPGIEI